MGLLFLLAVNFLARVLLLKFIQYVFFVFCCLGYYLWWVIPSFSIVWCIITGICSRNSYTVKICM